MSIAVTIVSSRPRDARQIGLPIGQSVGIRCEQEIAVADRSSCLSICLTTRCFPTRPEMRHIRDNHSQFYAAAIAFCQATLPRRAAGCTMRAEPDVGTCFPFACGTGITRQMKLLLTGGCGFIGSAVVRHLLRHTDHVVVNVDKMTYAASEEALEEARGHRRHVLVRADIADAAAMRADLRDAPARRGDAPRRREPCRPLDRRAGRVHRRPTSSAPSRCWRRRGATAPTLTPARRAAFRFHHISTDEVFGALGPDDPPFDETTPYDPRSPYSASKAASDHLVRAWFHTYGLPTIVSQHRQQLRPVAVPGEADPAGHAERAGGQAAAGLRRRLQPARLDLRRGPRRGAGARAGAGRAGRHLRDRRPPAAQQPRRGARDLRPSRPPRCRTRPARASG